MYTNRTVGLAMAALLALLVVTGAVAPLAAAQAANGSDGGATAPTAANGNSSRNSTAGNGTAPGVYGGGSPVGYPGYNETAANQSEDGNFSNVCEGLGPGAWVTCKGATGAVGGILDGMKKTIMKTLQNTAEKFIKLILSRPIPLRNGVPEFVLQPTNPPMTTVYQMWWTVGLPAGLCIWVLYMLLMQFSQILPSGMVDSASRQRAQMKGWFALFDIILSWTQAAIIVTLAYGIAQWFAPSGDQVIASFEAIGTNALAAGIGALLVWLSSGVLLVLVAFVWAISFLGVFVLMPAYPLATALALPDFWIFKPLSIPGKWLQGMFVPCAFMPVPPAIILGVGYPVINAVRGELVGPFGQLLGIPTYVILVLVMWFVALVSPLLLLASGRKLRPMAAFTAGAVGAAGVASASGRIPSVGKRVKSAMGGSDEEIHIPWNSSSSSSSASTGTSVSNGRVDPIAGSPYAGSGGSRYGGGQSNAGVGGTPAAASSQGGGGGPSPGGSRALGPGEQTAQSGATAASSGARSSTGSGSTAGGASSGAPRGSNSAVSSPGPIRVESINELDAEQDYTPGYRRDDGEFQPVVNAKGRDRDFLLERGGFDRISESHSEKDLQLRGDDDGQLYDVQDVARTREEFLRDTESRTRESRDTVFDGTRSRGD